MKPAQPYFWGNPPVIDRENPLSAGLIAAWVATHPSWEAVNRRRPFAPLGGASYLAERLTPAGKAVYPNNTVNGILSCADTSSGSISSALYDKAGPPLTVCGLMQGVSSTGNSSLIINRGNGSGWPAWGVGLHKGTLNGGYGSLRTSGGTLSIGPVSSGFDVTASPVFVTLSIGVSTTNLYTGNRTSQSGVTPSGNFYYEYNDQQRSLSVSGGYGSLVSSSILALVYNRAISYQEHLALVANPWQLFQPLARRVVSFPSAAGANPTILGVATPAQAGTVAVITSSNAVVTGRAIASAAGTVSISTTALVPLAGAASPVAAGTVAPVIGTAVTAVGAAIPVAAGIVQVRVDTNPVLVGASISTATGTVSITTTGDVNVNLTGVAAQVQPGNVSVQADAPIGTLPSAFGGGGGHKGWDRKEYKRKRKFLDDLDRTVEEAATPPAPPAAARRIELDLSTLQAAITKPYIRPSVPPKPLVDDNEEEFLLIHLLLD